MKDSKKYYENTKNAEPNKLVKKFIEMNVEPTRAVELGCGAGRDTAFLIKNGWNVTAIDKEDIESYILEKLDGNEKERFKFERQSLEELKLERNKLVVANFSLSFCNKKFFNKMWNAVSESILPGGYFVGNIFGVNDQRAKFNDNMTFLDKVQVYKLFEKFDIVFFEEVERDFPTAMGNIKHWHLFFVIAVKR